jgi:hypothetical protein
MSKTRKNRSNKNLLKKITRTGKRAIPVVKTGLKTVGKTAKGVVMKTEPVIESGVSKVYGTMVEGFDLGVKGVKGLTSKMTKSKRRRHR